MRTQGRAATRRASDSGGFPIRHQNLRCRHPARLHRHQGRHLLGGKHPAHRRVHRRARPQRLREIHHAAPHRRPCSAVSRHLRQRPCPRRTRHRTRPGPRLRLPGLCQLPPPHRARQRRLRARMPTSPGKGTPRARPRVDRQGRARSQKGRAQIPATRAPVSKCWTRPSPGTIAHQFAVAPPDRPAREMQQDPVFLDSVRHVRSLLDKLEEEKTRQAAS